MSGNIFNYTNLHKWKTRDAVHCFDWAFPGVDWESCGPNELCRIWNLSRGEQYGHFLTSDVLFVDIGSWVCKAWLKMKADQEKKVQERVGRSVHVGVQESLEKAREVRCADSDRKTAEGSGDKYMNVPAEISFLTQELNGLKRHHVQQGQDLMREIREMVKRIERIDGFEGSDSQRINGLACEIEKIRQGFDNLKFEVNAQKKEQSAVDSIFYDRINKLEKDDAVAKIALLEKELEYETILRNALYDSLKKQVEILQRRANMEIRS